MEIIQLGPVNLLRTIFIIFLVYYGFKLIWPFIRRKIFSQNEDHSSTNKGRSRRRGITVEYPEEGDKNPSSEKLGDFVDYEEIK
jgi:hypothetical protein